MKFSTNTQLQILYKPTRRAVNYLQILRLPSESSAGCKEVSSNPIFSKLMAQSKMKGERIFRRSLHLTVCCFVFTAYQSIQCMIKYQSFPKGTSTKILPSNMVGNNFPAISICPRSTTALNEKILQECLIKGG